MENSWNSNTKWWKNAEMETLSVLCLPIARIANSSALKVFFGSSCMASQKWWTAVWLSMWCICHVCVLCKKWNCVIWGGIDKTCRIRMMYHLDIEKISKKSPMRYLSNIQTNQCIWWNMVSCYVKTLVRSAKNHHSKFSCIKWHEVQRCQRKGASFWKDS